MAVLPHNLTEVTGPLFGAERVGKWDHDLTRQHAGEPLGQRIVVHGRVTDREGHPIPDTLIEVWQATPPGVTATAATSATARRSIPTSPAAAAR